MSSENVARGVEWLDENHPGWRKEINRENLDMSKCSMCILGQVTGYEDGVRLLDIDGLLPQECGFDLVGIPLDRFSRETAWEELTKEWIDVL